MSTSIDSTILQMRNRVKRKEKNLSEPTACWTGKDLINGKIIASLTIILKTVGCRFAQKGGCTMCGYINDATEMQPSEDELIAQFTSALKKSPKSDFIVKIFTSGSFFDTKEVPLEVQNQVLEMLNSDEKVQKVILETRPEFVTPDNMRRARMIFHKPLEIAMGLETANDTIRSFCINKKFTFNDFAQSCNTARGEKITCKAYLLLKPPFLSEGDAIIDAIDSVSKAAEFAETISINICNIQKGTLIEHLYQRKGYRPPWLWSIVEVLKIAKRNNPDTTIVSDPVAAGTRRGPYNCPECNKTIVRLIDEFSLTQDTSHLEKYHCDCKYLWEKVVQLEDCAYGAQL